MRSVPLFSQKAVFKDRIFEFGSLYIKFETCPSSDVLDKNDMDFGKAT